jgi:hypothetical protein
MKREFHVRFCERPKGRFLWPTRPAPCLMPCVMLRQFEDETYLMRLKNGHSFRLLETTNFAAWEVEYDYGISSLVLPGRQF